MKRYSKHNILCHLALLAIAGSVLSACVDDEEMLSPLPSLWTQGLTVQPYIEGSKMATRAYNYYDDNNYAINDDVPADDELKENDLGTKLDVFIAGQDNDPFWMQYHLVQGQETTNGVAGVQASVLNETADLLAKNWTDVVDPNGNKLVSGQKYDVYVAVNNTATNATIASKADLLALTYNNGVVYKLFGTTTTGAFDASRRMLMDGHIEWTCQNLPLQKIEVPLKRAEAKVVITVDFSPAFMAQLREETGLDTPIGIPTASAPFTGAPAWKYVNWCMDTKVFADGNDITPTLNTDEGRENMTENSLLNEQPYYYYNGKEMQEDGTLSTDTDTEVYFTDHDEDTDEFGRKYIDLYPVADELSDGHSVERTANNVPRARLITYTYTTSWDHHADERAPYVLVSYPFFRKKEGVTTVSSSNDLITTFNYYRIPVCDEQANTELKRNYIYKVNAIISGAGSTSFTENEANVKLHYEVLPWTHDADEDVKVKGESFHYFYVTPTTYNLRGDNTQSVNLNYYAAKGDVVKFKNLQVYYYNSGGNKVTIYNSTDTENANGLTTKSLTNNNAGRNYSVTINNDGTITVSSEALANRAVKYISFTAFMTYVDEEGHTQTMTEDIVIKHFPLDNIQNVAGSWSSKYTGIGTTTTTVTEYTYTPEEDGWEEGTYSEYNTEYSFNPTGEGWKFYRTVTETNASSVPAGVTDFTTNETKTPLSYYNAYVNGYDGYEDLSVSLTDLLASVDLGDLRYTERSYIDNQEWYEGTYYAYYYTNGFWCDNYSRNSQGNVQSHSYNAQTKELTINYRERSGFGWQYLTKTINNIDYVYQSGNNNYTLYYYTFGNCFKRTYYNVTTTYNYTANQYRRIQYVRNISQEVPVYLGGWVMWDPDHETHYGTSKTVSDSWMSAKVFRPGLGIYKITQSGSYGNYYANYGSQYKNATAANNHMYIIQIANTSDQYVLGRPIVNPNTHLSNDHVVSPAFMIASQLGAFDNGSTGLNGQGAATHCSQYLETSIDGTIYAGWRLPTKEEINVIIDYQYDTDKRESIAEVLTAHYYYSLDGTTATNSQYTGTNGSFVRCVRDLSPEEVEAINNKQ